VNFNSVSMYERYILQASVATLSAALVVLAESAAALHETQYFSSRNICRVFWNE
jgi:hypothetical protein